MLYYVNLLLVVLFSLLRLFMFSGNGELHKEDIFKDFAHLFTGFLFGCGLKYRWGWQLGIIITVVEVVAFFLSKM